jgi:3-oxoadipate enol-lactonase
MPIVKVNGIHIYYDLQGSKDLPCLVLNNGILMNAATGWKLQEEIFSKSYRLLKYDFRGQGDSEHPKGEYTMELHTDDLAELMTNLNIKKAHIAGLSYGGAVAQAFVLKYPELCHSLILAGITSEISSRLKLIVNGWLNHAKNGDLESFFSSTVPWFFTSETIVENPQILENAKKRYAKLDFSAVAKLCKCFLSVNFTQQLKEISVPTCILVGEKDLLAEHSYVEIMHQNIPTNELHIIPSAGHVICWERVEEFNSIIMGFLSKQMV